MCLGYGITRKIVKRNVMTYSYGSKVYGMTEQLREDLMQPLSKEVQLRKLDEHPFAEGGYWVSKYLEAISTMRLKSHTDTAQQWPSCKSWHALCRVKVSRCSGKHL